MDRAATEIVLVRAERTGDVHIGRGAAVKSRGRYVMDTLCDRLVAGLPNYGDSSTVTCRECRSEYVPGEDWSRT